ncbi:hypothetical protein NEAUS03_1028 [Nematocida ausubeli]|nr:hypothetical protein NEAUS03_1028 [Nematocida ausubeli]
MHEVFTRLVGAAVTAVEKIAKFIVPDAPEEITEEASDPMGISPGEYRQIYKGIQDVIENNDELGEEEINKISSLLNTVVQEEDLPEYIESMRFLKELAQGKGVDTKKEEKFIRYVAGKEKRKTEDSGVSEEYTEKAEKKESEVKCRKTCVESAMDPAVAVDTGNERRNITGFTAEDFDETVDWEGERRKEMKKIDDVLALGLNPFNRFRDEDGIVKYPDIDDDAELIKYDEGRNVLKICLHDDPRRGKYLPYYCIHPTENKIVRSMGIAPGAIESLTKLQMKERGFIREEGRLERDRVHAEKTDRWSKIIREQKEREKKEQERKLAEARKRFNDEYAERERLRLLQEEELKKREITSKRDPVYERIAQINETIDKERAGRDYKIIQSVKKTPEAQKELDNLIHDAIRETSKGLYDQHHYEGAMDLYEGSKASAEKTKVQRDQSIQKQSEISNSKDIQIPEDTVTRSTSAPRINNPLQSTHSIPTSNTLFNTQDNVHSKETGILDKEISQASDKIFARKEAPYTTPSKSTSPFGASGFPGLGEKRDTSSILKDSPFTMGESADRSALPGTGLFGSSINNSLNSFEDRSRDSTQMESSNTPTTDSINLPRDTLELPQKKDTDINTPRSVLLSEQTSPSISQETNNSPSTSSLFGKMTSEYSPSHSSINLQQTGSALFGSVLGRQPEAVKNEITDSKTAATDIIDRKRRSSDEASSGGTSLNGEVDYSQSPLAAFQKRIMMSSQNTQETPSRIQPGTGLFSTSSTQQTSPKTTAFPESQPSTGPSMRSNSIFSSERPAFGGFSTEKSNLFPGSAPHPETQPQSSSSIFNQTPMGAQGNLFGSIGANTMQNMTGAQTAASSMSSRFNATDRPGATETPAMKTQDGLAETTSSLFSQNNMSAQERAQTQNPPGTQSPLGNSFSNLAGTMNTTNPFGTTSSFGGAKPMFSNPQASPFSNPTPQFPTGVQGNNMQGETNPFANNSDGNTGYTNPFAGKDTVRKRSSFMFKK